MTDTVFSNCEKKFIIKCLSQNIVSLNLKLHQIRLGFYVCFFSFQRLDGRNFNDFRSIDIQFGSEYGCVVVSLGETKVLAQVSCEITQPRATRPAEGTLFINVNSGQEKRSSELIVLLTRNLERALKESRCVDLESLCIKAEEKVWRIRVDVNILNHEGNLTGKFFSQILTIHDTAIRRFIYLLLNRLCFGSCTCSVSSFQNPRCDIKW